jgi:hypothetical protein
VRGGRLRSVEDLKALGVWANRAAPFILLDGHRPAVQLRIKRQVFGAAVYTSCSISSQARRTVYKSLLLFLRIYGKSRWKSFIGSYVLSILFYIFLIL